MLKPVQVAEKLLHKNPTVRLYAIDYLKNAHDPAPATADNLWAAIDLFQDDAAYDALASLPQTENSLNRTLQALELRPMERRQAALEKVLRGLSYGLLTRFGDLIDAAGALSQRTRDMLAQRRQFAMLPPDALWERLEKAARQADTPNAFESLERPESDNLILALARSVEAASWAVGVLNDPEQKGSLRAFSVKLLGEMRYRPATRLLADQFMFDPDYDELVENVFAAIVRVGSPEVVRALQQDFPTYTDGLHIMAASALGQIKLPQSEAALVDLLGKARDGEAAEPIAIGLCEIGTTNPAALARLREIYLNPATSSALWRDVQECIVSLFAVFGQALPAPPRPAPARPFARGDDDWTDEEVAPQQIGPAPRGQFDVPKPIRRDAPKVGRNDPCPCGSGKKHKKCCGK